MDIVFIGRVLRSLKHEDIYLKGYVDGREAKVGIASWIAFYNEQRLHQRPRLSHADSHPGARRQQQQTTAFAA